MKTGSEETYQFADAGKLVDGSIEWGVSFYLSGSTVVVPKNRRINEWCWFYVIGPYNNQGTYDQKRRDLCYDLAQYLNDGTVPEWFKSLKPSFEIGYRLADGARFYAYGKVSDAVKKAYIEDIGRHIDGIFDRV